METHTEYLKRMGKRLKELRIERGFTSYENFAMEYDLSRRFYWSVEKGNNFTMSYLLKLLNIHNISLNDFINSL